MIRHCMITLKLTMIQSWLLQSDRAQLSKKSNLELFKINTCLLKDNYKFIATSLPRIQGVFSMTTTLMESSLIRSSPNSSAPSMGHQSIPKKVLHLGTEVHKTKIHGASGFDVSSIHGNKTARNITLVSRKKGNERLLENISLFANLKCITGVAFLMNSFMSTTGPNSEGSTPT